MDDELGGTVNAEVGGPEGLHVVIHNIHAAVTRPPLARVQHVPGLWKHVTKTSLTSSLMTPLANQRFESVFESWQQAFIEIRKCGMQGITFLLHFLYIEHMTFFNSECNIKVKRRTYFVGRPRHIGDKWLCVKEAADMFITLSVRIRYWNRYLGLCGCSSVVCGRGFGLCGRCGGCELYGRSACSRS